MKKTLALIMSALLLISLTLISASAAAVKSPAENYSGTSEEILNDNWKTIETEYFAMSMDFKSYLNDGSGGNGCVGFYFGGFGEHVFMIGHDALVEPFFASNVMHDWGGVWQQNRTYLADMGIPASYDEPVSVNLTLICRKGESTMEVNAYINGTQVKINSDTVGTYTINHSNYTTVGLCLKLFTDYENIVYISSDSAMTYDDVKKIIAGEYDNGASSSNDEVSNKDNGAGTVNSSESAGNTPNTSDTAVSVVIALVGVAVASVAVCKKNKKK